MPAPAPAPESGGGVWARLRSIVGGGAAEPGVDFQSNKQAIAGYRNEVAAGHPLRPVPVPAPAAGQTASAASVPGQPSVSAAAGTTPAPAAAPGQMSAPAPSVLKKFVSQPEKWHAPQILKTNLIRDEVATFVNWSRQATIVGAVVLLALAMVGAVFGGLVYWEQQLNAKGDELQTDIDRLKTEIADAESGLSDIRRYETQASVAAQLLDRHVYYSQVLEFLETRLLRDVYIVSGLAGDTSGKFTFTMQGTSYDDIVNQLAVLRADQLVRRADVSSASLAGGKTSGAAGVRSVSFTLDLVLDPAVFRFNYGDRDLR